MRYEYRDKEKDWQSQVFLENTLDIFMSERATKVWRNTSKLYSLTISKLGDKYLSTRYFYTSNIYRNKQGASHFVVLTTAALRYRKPASARAFSDSCDNTCTSRNSDERNTLYYLKFTWLTKETLWWSPINKKTQIYMTFIWHIWPLYEIYDLYMTYMTFMWHIWHLYDIYDIYMIYMTFIWHYVAYMTFIWHIWYLYDIYDLYMTNMTFMWHIWHLYDI
jgi:hypothetical protein